MENHKFSGKDFNSNSLVKANNNDNDVEQLPLLKADVFDLDELNLQQLANNLKENLEKINIGNNCIFLWGGRRQLKRQEINIRQQQLILEQIQNLQLTAEELAKLKASLFLIPQTVEALIEGRTAELRIAKERFDTEIERLRQERLAIKQKREIELMKAEAEIEKEKLLAQAEASVKFAQSEEIKARASLITFVLENIDLNKLPPDLKAYCIASIFNPNTAQDFSMQERIKDFVEQQLQLELKAKEQEIKQIEAEGNIKQAEAKVAKEKAKLTIEDFAKIRRASKSK